MRDLMAITSALADPNRVRALCALQPGECCVCQMVELLALAPSTVSKHLSILKQAGLVESRKQGRWMHYRLPDEDAPPIVRQAIAWVLASMKNEPEKKADAKSLKRICAEDPEDLCRRQMGRDCCPPGKKSPAGACR